MFTSQQITDVLAKVLDPETHLSIVAMGLIYQVAVLENPTRIKIQYTLTTPLCPLAGVIQERIRAEIALAFPQFLVTPESVITELVFDPPWTLERLSEEARAELGFSS